MKGLFILLIHLVAVLARLAGPGGVRGLVAENLLMKEQLLILSRSRQRAPNLSSHERFVLGFCTPFVSRFTTKAEFTALLVARRRPR